MACESHRGTRVATSSDGIEWLDHGLWIPISGSDFDAFGQVTPCLLARPESQDVLLYFGAAAASTWDHNTIAVHKLSLPMGNGGTEQPKLKIIALPDFSESIERSSNPLTRRSQRRFAQDSAAAVTKAARAALPTASHPPASSLAAGMAWLAGLGRAEAPSWLRFDAARHRCGTRW